MSSSVEVGKWITASLSVMPDNDYVMVITTMMGKYCFLCMGGGGVEGTPCHVGVV